MRGSNRVEVPWEPVTDVVAGTHTFFLERFLLWSLYALALVETLGVSKQGTTSLLWISS